MLGGLALALSFGRYAGKCSTFSLMAGLLLLMVRASVSIGFMRFWGGGECPVVTDNCSSARTTSCQQLSASQACCPLTFPHCGEGWLGMLPVSVSRQAVLYQYCSQWPSRVEHVGMLGDQETHNSSVAHYNTSVAITTKWSTPENFLFHPGTFL